MRVRFRWPATVGLFGLVIGAFFSGRHAQETLLAANAHPTTRASASSSPMVAAGPPSYRQLAAIEIVALPFAQFYEALRSAPKDAREKWAFELEKMADGPRRSAAISAFYKLLVQFDPTTAVRNISEIKDKEMRRLALAAAVNAAPGSAMREMAELALKFQTPGASRDPLWDVFYDWMDIDPAAVAKFIGEHPQTDFERGFSLQSLMCCWAGRDPKGAKEWMEKNGKSEVPEIRRGFFEGWYETNPAAATGHLLAHASESEMKGPISTVLALMYVDSPEETKKFIEALPDESSRRDAFQGAFESCVVGEEEELGEPNLTPRAWGDWMTQFPPEYWKGRLSRIFEWGRSTHTSPQTLEWIAQQPSSIRDLVAAEYAKPSLEPVAEAVAPLLQIPDTKLREQLLIAMFKHDNDSADDVRNALGKVPFSAEQKDYLRGVFELARKERIAEWNRGD